jgi:hypothetical protein
MVTRSCYAGTATGAAGLHERLSMSEKPLCGVWLCPATVAIVTVYFTITIGYTPINGEALRSQEKPFDGQARMGAKLQKAGSLLLGHTTCSFNSAE